MPSGVKINWESVCSDFGYKYISHDKFNVTFEMEGFVFTQPKDSLNKSMKPTIKNAHDKTKYFIYTFKNKYPSDDVDFSKFMYNGASKFSTVTCPKHGDYQTKPNWLNIRGKSCDKCGKERIKNSLYDTTEKFIKKSKVVHGNTYDYSKAEYIDCRTPVTITCKTHGDYSTIPYYHTAGQGMCPKCYRNNNTFNEKSYKSLCPNGSNIYIVKLGNGDEVFYKIGISKNVKERYKAYTKLGYNIIESDIIFYEYAGDIYSIEQVLHTIYQKSEYIPKIDFKGKTECFSYLDVAFVKLEVERFINFHKESKKWLGL